MRSESDDIQEGSEEGNKAEECSELQNVAPGRAGQGGHVFAAFFLFHGRRWRVTFQDKKPSSIVHSLRHGVYGIVGHATSLDSTPRCTGLGSQGSGSLALRPLGCGVWKWPEAELATASPCQDRHPVCSAAS